MGIFMIETFDKQGWARLTPGSAVGSANSHGEDVSNVSQPLAPCQKPNDDIHALRTRSDEHKCRAGCKGVMAPKAVMPARSTSEFHATPIH
jgi:hypothetical protein